MQTSLSLPPSRQHLPTHFRPHLHAALAQNGPKAIQDAPTPNPSPAKHRIFKRREKDVLPPPPQPVFGPPTSSSTCDTTADVFGPVMRSPKCDGYVTDSESETDGGGRSAVDDDGYAWGPEDDAPLPPESQMSSQITVGDTKMVDEDSFHDDLPALQDISDSSEDEGDDSGAHSPVDDDSFHDDLPALQDISDSSEDEGDDSGGTFSRG
ncbi:hypothetical protein B0H14DRAFT_1079654 [Mycena olivaceomarginata]|nr:hypothetical protein B0H14DRAFT_1079654 [Mycena olivaceomarginata]